MLTNVRTGLEQPWMDVDTYGRCCSRGQQARWRLDPRRDGEVCHAIYAAFLVCGHEANPVIRFRYMFDRVRQGEFYIICPDNETYVPVFPRRWLCETLTGSSTYISRPPELDHLRIKWSAGDILEGRPALSRWHPEWKYQFEEYVRENMQEVNESRADQNADTS